MIKFGEEGEDRYKPVKRVGEGGMEGGLPWVAVLSISGLVFTNVKHYFDLMSFLCVLLICLFIYLFLFCFYLVLSSVDFKCVYWYLITLEGGLRSTLCDFCLGKMLNK